MRVSKIVHAIDLHACGEPGRVIVGGITDVPGETMYDKMCHLEKYGDNLRKRMLREPRGYPAANCNIVLPSRDPNADAGFVILEQVEYPLMSGSNIICVATALVETGMVAVTEPETVLTLEAPAGLVTVTVQVKDGKAKSVTFENVPAFAVHLDQCIDVPEIGNVCVDVAWGGMFYVIADAESLGIELLPDRAGEITRAGEMIKAAAREQLPCVHPENSNVSGVTICVMTGTPTAQGATAKNAVVVSTGQLDWKRPTTWTGVLDRSPCGTGTCARMAALYAKGELGLNENFNHEGILGTIFTGRLIRETQMGNQPAVVPTIQGQAWITGLAQYVVDVDDPFPDGFTVGDIWGGAIDEPLAH